jgi:hypothetical protein
MWRPRTLDDIKAAVGVVAEGHQIDFKPELSSPAETATDIAAMTVHGGVLIYGVDEANGVATAITPVPLRGARERVQQIADTAITPAPDIEIEVLTEPGAPSDGIVVVVVPPSSLAPHCVSGRFPARSNTTTRYLAESEIEALYEQRRRLTPGTADLPILEGFVSPGLEGAQGVRGVGTLRLAVAPIAPTRHPFGHRLREPLNAASKDALDALRPWLAEDNVPASIEFIHDWRPHGTIGWEAGEASSDHRELLSGTFAAATFSYTGTFSFLVTTGVVLKDGRRAAGEHFWAMNTMACLAIAGCFFRRVPGAALMRVDVGLQGLGTGLSNRALRGDVSQPRAISDSDYKERVEVTAPALAADPQSPARGLLERLFVSYLLDSEDPFADLAPGS